MFKMLKRIKHSLSHISESSWHWRMTYEWWGSKARGKACAYYWVKVPGAAFCWLALSPRFRCSRGRRSFF